MKVLSLTILKLWHMSKFLLDRDTDRQGKKYKTFSLVPRSSVKVTFFKIMSVMEELVSHKHSFFKLSFSGLLKF